MNRTTAGSCVQSGVVAGKGMALPTACTRFRICRIVFLTLLLPAFLSAATPEEGKAGWRVGLASVVITPPKPVPLAGYAARKGSFQRVEQDIHAKVLALEDEEGGRALLVTCDLVGLNHATVETICGRIIERSGLPREAIILNFSHTHTGPAATLKMPSQGRYSKTEAESIVAYGHWLADRIVETAMAALEQRKPATLSYGSGQVKFPVNRRQHTANGVVLGFDPQGPIDRSVPVLGITTPEGELLGVVFGAACHNTCLGAKDNFICGDYAGYAQELLEKAMGGAQAMFVQGCGGDASPYPTGSLAAARVHGVELAKEVGRVLGRSRLRPVHGPIRSRLKWVDLPLEKAPTLEEIQAMTKDRLQWRRQAVPGLLARYHAGELETVKYPAPLALWQFGSDLTFVGLPGEPVADYVKATKKAIGRDNLWIAGYCNDHFGYLTNARILKEGGYEAGRGPGSGRRLAPNVEDVVTQGLRELSAAVGRQSAKGEN